MPLLLPLCTRRVLTFDDLTAIHLPLRYVYASALRAGDSVLWSSAFHSGLYLFAEGEAGMAHPLHLALYRLLPLDIAFNLEVITSYAAALIGMRLLLARLQLSREAAWFGGMVFAFSGFSLLHLMHVNAVAVVAHTPWLLLATHLLLTSSSRRARAVAFGAFALLLASELLLGHAQYVCIMFVAVVWLAVGLAAAGTNRFRLAWLCGATVLGVGVGAVQWLPTLDAVAASIRAVPSLAFRLSYSLPPIDVIQLWSPYAFASRAYVLPDESAVHEFSVYNGAFCVLALSWLLVRWPSRKHSALTIGLLGLAAFSLLMAFGRFGGIYPLAAALPGISAFRAPARFLALFQLALSGIAAIVFDDLLAMVRDGGRVAARRLWPIAVLAGVGVATTILAAALSASMWPTAHGIVLSGFRVAALWSLPLIASAGLMTMAARGVRWSVPLLVVVTAIDLGGWGYSYIYSGGLRSVAQLTASAPAPPAARPGDLYEPTATGNGPAENLGVLRDLRLSIGNMGIKPAAVLLGDLTALRLAGVDWHSTVDGWTRIPEPMPRVRLVSSVERADDSKKIRAAIGRIDIARVAVVSGSVSNLSGDNGSARMISDRPGRMIVETQAPGGQLLVTTERFHAGWRAVQDGVPVQTVRTNGDFLGCRVGAGTHRIELAFSPRSFRNGLRLTLAGLALTLVAVGVLWTRQTP